MCGDVGRCVEVCGDVGRCEEVWEVWEVCGDVGRCVEVRGGVWGQKHWKIASI